MLHSNPFEDERYYSNQNLKVCGNIIYHSIYERSFRIGGRFFKRKKDIDESKIDEIEEYSEEEIRGRVFRRARKRIIYLINSNSYTWKNGSGRPYPPIFLTLTFKENIKDTERANREFSKFIQRFNYEITSQKKSYLKYVAVIEFQKRGSIHYHVMFFNLPFIEKIYDKLNKIWPAGYFKINKADNIRDVGFYVAKYMHKDFDDPRLKGHKCYFTSRYLKQPISISFVELINIIKPLIPKDTLEYKQRNIPIKFLISMDKDTYNLKDYPEVREQILDLINQYL